MIVLIAVTYRYCCALVCLPILNQYEKKSWGGIHANFELIWQYANLHFKIRIAIIMAKELEFQLYVMK